MATSPWADREARAFLLRKLFSLTGIVPLGAFTIFHLWKNATALHGREAFTAMAEEINAMPYLFFFEVAFIFLPLLLHAILGILIILDARYNVKPYPSTRNWMFTFQRVSGVLAFGFILYHLITLRLPKFRGELQSSGFYDALCSDLSSTLMSVPVTALVYIVGIAAVAFHLSNGLWGFLCSWGITPTRRSQRISAGFTGVLGILVFVLGANTTLYFATGSKLFIPSSTEPTALQHCPQSALEAPATTTQPDQPAPDTSAPPAASEPPPTPSSPPSTPEEP